MKIRLILLIVSLAACLAAQEKPVAVLQTETGVHEIAFSPDGKQIATLDEPPHTLSVWEVESGRKLAELHRTSVPIVGPTPPRPYTTGVAGPENGSLIAFAPDGHHLATYREPTDPMAPPMVWDLETGEAMGPWNRSPSGELTLADTKWTPEGIRSWRPDSHAGLPSDLAKANAVSHDGRLAALLTGAKDTAAIGIWDVKANRQLASIPVAGKSNTNIEAFSPDGLLLAIVVGNGAEVWSLNPVAKVKTVLPDLWIYRVGFSPNGGYLAVLGSAEFYILRVSDWHVVLHYVQPQNQQASFYDMAFSPDSSRFAVADGSLHLWNLQDGEHRSRFGEPSKPRIQAIAATPNNTFLAAARGALPDGMFAKNNSTIELWPLDGPPPRVLAENLFSVKNLAFSHDSQWLATATLAQDTTGRYTQIFSGDVELWHVADGKNVQLKLSSKDGSAENEWSASSVAFSPDNRQLVATVLTEGTLPARDCSPDEPCGDPENIPYDVRTTFFDISTGHEVNSTPLGAADSGDPDSPGLFWLSPDGRRAFMLANQLSSVDTLNGRYLRAFQAPTLAPQPGAAFTSECDLGLHAFGFVAFRPDMAQVAVSDGQAIAIFDAKTGASLSGEPVQISENPQDSLFGLTAAFSPDGKTLAVLSCSPWVGSGEIQFYDSPALRLRATIKTARAVNSLAFTADGTLLSTGGYEGLLRLWNTKDGSLAATLVRSDAGWIVFASDGLFDASENGGTLLAWRFHGRLVTAGDLPGMRLPGLLAKLIAGEHPSPPNSLESALAKVTSIPQH